MCARADRQVRPLFRLMAVACLILMTIGLADRSLASAYDAGTHAEATSQASCDARHPDSGCPHPDHADESDIPVVDAPDGLGLTHSLCSHRPDGGTAVPQKPPVRPPSI